VADAYDSAQQQINNQKAALLAAMAAQGTQGKNYYDATQADLAAQRSAAVAQALQEAQNRGAPANLLASIQSQVEAPFSRASTNVNNGAIAEQTWRNNLGDATANYMDQQVAAIPGLRIIAQTKAAEAKAKADLQAAKDAASLARTNRTAAGKSGSGGGPKFSSSLASASTKAATQAHQQKVLADMPNYFGPRAQAAFSKVVSSAKDVNAAIAMLDAGATAGKNPDGSVRAPVFWKGTPVPGQLDYNAMLNAIRAYYGQPTDDELSQAQQNVLNQGTY